MKGGGEKPSRTADDTGGGATAVAGSCSSAIVVSPTGQVVDLGPPPSAPSTSDTGNKRSRNDTPTTLTVVSQGDYDGALISAQSSDVLPRATPSCFKRALDQTTGRHYWYDEETRETFWTDPSIAPFKTAQEEPRKRRKTYGSPPTNVEAIGQNQEAAVWWKPASNDGLGDSAGGWGSAGTVQNDGGVVATPTDGHDRGLDLRILGYVVYRYRRDGHEWHKKGGTNVDGSKMSSTRVKGLQNGLAYRFTVATRIVEGESAESEPSVAIRPNEPLPEGWKEIFNMTTGKAVYKNLKTSQICAERPEGDPYFVESKLFLRFLRKRWIHSRRASRHSMSRNCGTSSIKMASTITRGEGRRRRNRPQLCNVTRMEAFRKRAEIATSVVSVDDTVEILPTLGEPVCAQEVLKGLKKDGWEGGADSSEEANVTYRQFLALLWGIKGPKMAKKSLSTRVWDALVWIVTPRSVSAAKQVPQEKDPGKRMGAWEKLIHPVARRPYFVNKDTGQACWKTPAEVKFFLSDALRTSLLKDFSEDDLLHLRKAFAKMDLDDSGSIDADELGLILTSFGEAVPPGRVRALIREVSRHGSGEIGFEEFTVMVQAVKKGSASLGWGRIKRNLEAEGGRLHGLVEQFQGIKARGAGGAGDAWATEAGWGGNAKRPDHGKFCLCGCRGITPTGRERAVIYKEWGTARHRKAKK